jgi:NAD(P)-dependent dehydrogenase (short-subunit alcohol dehydrogenase family)
MELFNGDIALISGANKGIGYETARGLGAKKITVLVGARDEARGQAAVAKLKAEGADARFVKLDVSDHETIRRAAERIEKEFGRLDILVNNAGIFFPAKFEDLTEEQWDRIMNTNLKSQFLCAQTAAPIMKRQGRGRIINLSSLGGLLAWPLYTHYCVSKAGTIMLTRCLARALAPEILVNSVAPGTIQFPGEPPDEEYIRRVPLHRTGTGDDIADAVAYLATADFVTGQTIVVDGGRSLI